MKAACMVKQNGTWKVVHVHKSPAWQAPHMPVMMRFPGKLALQQRVLPIYRAPFFDLLASACERWDESVHRFAASGEGITVAEQLQITNYKLGRNIHLLSGIFYLCYQRGLIDLAKRTKSRCADCRSQPALSFHIFCCQVDAWNETSLSSDGD